MIAVGFNFAPDGWHICDGSLLQISQYETLFNLIGTTYGGDGQATFGLPDLRGRAVVGMGQGPGFLPYTLGQPGGAESVTLASGQVGSHAHALAGGGDGDGLRRRGPRSFSGRRRRRTRFTRHPGRAPRSPAQRCLRASAARLPHENRQPSLAITYIISLFGIYPSQN